ncbi:hypothetical protein D3C86_1614400 [compost metagenome]
MSSLPENTREMRAHGGPGTLIRPLVVDHAALGKIRPGERERMLRMAVGMKLPIRLRIRQFPGDRKYIGGRSDRIFPSVQQQDAGIDPPLLAEFRRPKHAVETHGRRQIR